MVGAALAEAGVNSLPSSPLRGSLAKPRFTTISLPVVVLFAYYFSAGIFYKPSLQFYFLQNVPYIATAIMLGLELGLMATVLSLRLGRFERQPLTTSIPLLLVWSLIAWAGVSLAWSFTVKPFETTGYWVQQVTAVFLTLECCTYIAGQDGPALARRAYSAGLALLAVQAIAFHRLSMLDPLELEWYKNDYAHAAALLILMCLDALARHQWRIGKDTAGWLIAVMLGALVIAHYTSKTVVGALAAGATVHLLLGAGGRRKWMSVALLSVAATFALWEPIAKTWDAYNRDAAYASTFSERTVLWEYVWRFIGEHPVLGLGFDGFRNAVPGIFNVGVSHAHNDPMMVWVNLGLPGLALAAAWYLSFFLTSLNARRTGGQAAVEAVLPISLVVYTLIRGQLEADRFLTVLPIDLGTVCMIALARVSAAASASSASSASSGSPATPASPSTPPHPSHETSNPA